MKRRVIDLGWGVAILELTKTEEGQHVPNLTILTPETEASEPKCVEIWHSEGLHNLRDALAEGLDEYDSEAWSEQKSDVDKGD